MTNSVDLEVPREAVLRTLDVRGWTSGTWGDTDGPPDDPEAGPLCLHGAIRVCSPQPGDAQLIGRVWKRRDHGTDWNDRDGTTESDVLKYVQTAPEITDEELAETFGPQWREVVSLVRRAAVLTEDEASRLAAARVAQRDAARVAERAAERAAARLAAWYAARVAAGTAAWDAAWDAAGTAAWYAARAAALALCVRDLIGQHGFAQQHYDTLTRPWRTVIGPLHPYDKPATPLEAKP